MPVEPHRARALDRAAVRVLDRLAEAAEVLVPVECAVCRAPGSGLCRGCRMLLRRSCARPFEASSAAPLLGPCLPVTAAGRYAHELATCLLAFKNGGRTDLAPVLAAALATACVRPRRRGRRGRCSWSRCPRRRPPCGGAGSTPCSSCWRTAHAAGCSRRGPRSPGTCGTAAACSPGRRRSGSAARAGALGRRGRCGRPCPPGPAASSSTTC
ncbi:hypothetical protein [Kocuria sp. CNJ-770]|uniref:hypothetical protein n=1 Tax=Kocuria sp. CNJ-770 TaxID=1904964 RepID=UPI002101055A|nr:hypothetical protein [Kocuria sp. CNJ-770]